MGYAIIQKELVVPALDQLKRAFAVLPTLTELDAQTVAHDAYGILMRGLESEPAGLLQNALRAEGVDTEIIDEATLPAIPTARIVRQIEFHPDHFIAHDPMKRASAVPWADVMFIAAGMVSVRQRQTVKELETIGGTRAKEETRLQLLLDIFLHGGQARYHLNGDEFAYDCLGELQSEERTANFVALAQELSQGAPGAGLSRGAFMACQEPPELFLYPSKQTFNEELVWMLWRIAKLREQPAAE